MGLIKRWNLEPATTDFQMACTLDVDVRLSLVKDFAKAFSTRAWPTSTQSEIRVWSPSTPNASPRLGACTAPSQQRPHVHGLDMESSSSNARIVLVAIQSHVILQLAQLSRSIGSVTLGSSAVSLDVCRRVPRTPHPPGFITQELPEHTVVFDVLEKVVGHHHVKRIVLKRNAQSKWWSAQGLFKSAVTYSRLSCFLNLVR